MGGGRNRRFCFLGKDFDIAGFSQGEEFDYWMPLGKEFGISGYPQGRVVVGERF